MRVEGMGHALIEAHRVLAADGLLVDLRPTDVHRRVYAVSRGEASLLGVMRECFDEERAAERALAAAVRSGLFAQVSRTRFSCDRVATSLADFRDWLAGYPGLPPHPWLLRRAEEAFRDARAGLRIIIRAPIDLTLLRPRRP